MLNPPGLSGEPIKEKSIPFCRLFLLTRHDMRNKQCLCGIYDDIRTTAKIVASYDYFCSDFILFFYFKLLLSGKTFSNKIN